MKKGKKATQLLSVALIALTFTVGCSQRQRTMSVPQSNAVMVKTQNQNAEDIQKLFPTNQVSVVNKEAGLFKITGASAQDVKNKLPNAYVENDKITNFIHPDFKFQKTFDSEDQSIQCGQGTTINPEIQLLSQNAIIPNTNNVIRMSSGNVVLNAGVASSHKSDLLGSFVPSLATPPSTAGIKFRWIIQAPPGSSNPKQSDDPQLTINPDRVGSYEIALLALNKSTGVCEVTIASFGVTWDKPAAYQGPQGKPGQYSPAKFFHDPIIKADQAWTTAQGDGVTIAVIDTGINYNHPELSDNIKINKNEIPNNQIDDDGNGFVDDVYGWDFVENAPLPLDDESHGTHVSGLAAGESFGVAKKAKILPIKALDATGAASTSNVVSAIYYAIKQKADIINLSLGASGAASPVVLSAIKAAQDAGILIVAASGNGDETGKGIDTDLVESHFNQDDGPNILAVAATDENNALTSYSNYGTRTVGIAAPGGTETMPIISTYAFTDVSEYIGFAGTSMATPIVAGAAAVVKSANPQLSYQDIKDILISTSQAASSLNGKIGGGIVDVAAAAQEAQRRAGTHQLVVSSRH